MTRRRPCPAAPGPLEGYAARFDDVFGSLAQRRGFREYLAGLLAPRDRNKTLTALAGAGPVTGAASGGDGRVRADGQPDQRAGEQEHRRVRGHGRQDCLGGVDGGVSDQHGFAAEPVRGQATQDRADRGAERGAGDQVAPGKALQVVRDEVQRRADVGGVIAEQEPADGGQQRQLPVKAGRRLFIQPGQDVTRDGGPSYARSCGERDPGRLLCDLNMTAFFRFGAPQSCSGWSLAGWLQAAAAGSVVVSASGWPLRLVRWSGAV
jgi:hypothetical protein